MHPLPIYTHMYIQYTYIDTYNSKYKFIYSNTNTSEWEPTVHTQEHIIIIHNKFEQNPLKVNHIKLLPLYYFRLGVGGWWYSVYMYNVCAHTHTYAQNRAI